MAAETFRIEIPIHVEDKTDPGISQATQKINGFDKANQKTQERLNQMNRTKYQVVLDALDRASSVVGKVSSKARSIAGKTFSFTMKVIDLATAPLRGLWNFVTSIQGAILGATGAFAGIYKPMEIAGDFEQTQIAFETMLKSAEKAEKFLKEASQFANKTPFEFPELINSSKLMLAFGFEADKVLDILKVIGDTASGLGAGSEGIDRITRALGQMRAKGRAQAEELLQLQELGVPANQILQEELGLTGEQIANIGKESIEASKVIDALLRGMEKRFGGMMANQSRTAKGMISTLKDTLQNSLLRQWGEGLWAGIKPGLERLTNWIDENQDTIAEWGEAWKKAGENISKWVMARVEDLRSSIQRMTNSQEWKDAQTFGAKLKVAWNQIIAQPFNEWWNSTGKAWLADKASKIGEGIGSAITFGVLALLGVDTKSAMADGTSIGASFAEGFQKGFDGEKVGKALLDAIKGVFKDAGTLLPGGKEASSTSWISAILLTILGVKGAKGIGTIFKGGKGIYNFGKGLFKGAKAADAAADAAKVAGAAAGATDDVADIAKTTKNLKDAAESFRAAANASKEAEKAVKTAEALKAAKQADLEKSARLLKELKKEAAKFGDDIPKGLSGKIKAAEKAVAKGRVDVKKAASHLDDMVNLKNLKAIDYANAREGFVVAKNVANAAKVADKAGDVAVKTGIFSKIAGWFGKSGDDVLKAGSKAAGKGIKGIPVLGTLLGLAASGAVVASAAPENRGREAAGEVGSWLGAIGAGAGAGALVGTLGGGPIGTTVGGIVGGIGGAIGGEAFTEWLYDQKDAIASMGGKVKTAISEFGTKVGESISGFFTETIPNFMTEQIPYATGYATGSIGKFFTVTLPQGWNDLWTTVGNFLTETIPAWANGAYNTAVNFFTVSVPTFFTNLWNSVYGFFTETLPTWATGAFNKANEFFTQKVPEFFTDLWSSVSTFVTEKIPEYAKTLKDSVAGWFGSFRDWASNIWDKVKSSFSAGYEAGSSGGSNVAKHAYGGIMTKPHMGIVAEDGAEGIIPLSPSKRQRGLDLWQRTGELLGVRAYEDGGIVGEEPDEIPVASATGKADQNITIKVEVKAEPKFTIEGSGDNTDENKVVAILKAYIREMTDDIGDELAERLARIFANMPVKGGAEA